MLSLLWGWMIPNNNTVCIKNYPLLKIPVKLHLSSNTFNYISWRSWRALKTPQSVTLHLQTRSLAYPWLRPRCIFMCPFCCFGTGKSCETLNIYHPHEHHSLKGKSTQKVNILSPTRMSPATFFLPCNIKFEYLGCSFPYNEKNDSFVELQTVQKSYGLFSEPSNTIQWLRLLIRLKLNLPSVIDFLLHSSCFHNISVIHVQTCWYHNIHKKVCVQFHVLEIQSMNQGKCWMCCNIFSNAELYRYNRIPFFTKCLSS